ncbi:MAG: hypothetical protein ABJB12_12245 [Pseudomonadota bacterium]
MNRCASPAARRPAFPTRFALTALALMPAVSACSGADFDPGRTGAADAAPVIGEENVAVTQAGVAPPSLINSDPTLDQRFLPGMGYFDGTTCDIWPRDVKFGTSDDNMGVIASVLARYSIPSSVKILKSMTDRLRALRVSGASVIGSKNELVVTNAVLSSSERPLVAIDQSTRQGYMLENEWFCTEQMQAHNPLACKEYGVKVGKTWYSVIGRATKGSSAPYTLYGSEGIPSAPTVVVLTAPQVRFAPTKANGTITTNTFLIAIGQRVYGGSPYSPGEDLSQRAKNFASVSVRRNSTALAELPTRKEWLNALYEPRQPGFVALLGDEVGGFGDVSASAPAPVEQVVISYDYEDPAHFVPDTKTLYLTPEEYFAPSTSPCDPARVQGSLGTIACNYTVTLANSPRLHPPGGGGAAFFIAGATPNTANVSVVDDSTPIGVTYTLATLRRFLKGQLRPLLDPGANTVWVSQGKTTIDYVDGPGWLNTSGYASSALNDLQSELGGVVSAAFPASDATFPSLAKADGGTDTGVRQADMGAELFTQGAFSDVMFAHSELESLRTGEVASSWTDTFRLMTDYNLGARRISGFDALADMGIDPEKRTRAEMMDSYLAVAPDLETKSNVLGLSYGQTAGGWYALRDQGSVSLYGAQQRWNQLGSLIDNFQAAADKSYSLQTSAEIKALVNLVGALNTSLTRDISDTASAAATVSSAAKTNAATQQVSLDDFQKGYSKLFDLSASLQSQMNSVWGCAPGGSMNACLAAAKAKLNTLSNDCNPQNGFAWLKPVVGILDQYVPALNWVDTHMKEYTGKDLVDTMDALIEDPKDASIGLGENALQHYVSLTTYAKQFKDVDKYIGMGADYSKAMHKLIDDAPITCSRAAGQGPLDTFKAQVVIIDNLVQNYATQVQLVHAQISARLGHVGYLMTEGDAYDTLATSAKNNLKALKANTQPLLDQLNSVTAGASYTAIAAQQRAFLGNACHVALRATRASQADLHLVSQALQTSTGRGVTAPYLVLPADSAYHFADGAQPANLSPTDVNYGYATSLWDSGAFSARFTAAGDGATTSYLSRATTRLEQLMNGEVCEDATQKPATRFVVRKVFTGQALKTLVSSGAFDFKVTLDDIAQSGKDGSNPTRGMVAENFSSKSFDIKLDGGFVVSAGYSICNGATPGAECKTRVPVNSLSGVASGALNVLYLANRGTGAVPSVRALNGVCADNQEGVATSAPITLNSTAITVSSCLTPVFTPRTSANLLYFDNAAGPDSQVLNLQMQNAQCNIDAAVQASRPLQGVPVLGTWALANSGAMAASLNASLAAAQVSDAVLPLPKGATGIEVLFLVGAQPVGPNDDGGYTLASPQKTSL